MAAKVMDCTRVAAKGVNVCHSISMYPPGPGDTSSHFVKAPYELAAALITYWKN